MIDDQGLHLPGVKAGAPAVMVFFDDRHIWSFRPTGRKVEWPDVLRPFLDGTTRVRAATHDGETFLDEEYTFGTPSDAATRVAFVDSDGLPYAIDRMGHLTRSFASTAQEIKDEILEGTKTVIAALNEQCGVAAWLGYGALLGAVREGRMLGHDSDTDVCYTSRHTAPADIIAETFRIERTLKGLGWDVLRMSGGDLKVIWPLSDGRNCHIDVFSSFWIGDWFYVLGEHGGPYDAADLWPLTTVTLDGHELLAPANPEAMLAYLYGPTWRVPDPGYTPYIDPLIMTRLDGWLRGFRDRMGDWTILLRGTAGRKSPVPTTGSDFAEWVHRQIPADAAVMELGAGNGRDAVWFALQGHRVRSSDYSRRSKVETMALKKRLGASPKLLPNRHMSQVIMNESRQVLHLIAILAREPREIYSRQLLGCLDDAARDNLWQIGRTALRRGQSMWLEFSASSGLVIDPEPRPLVKRVDVGVLTKEIEAAGGTVAHVEIAPGVDMFDNPDPAVARMRVVWPQTKEIVR
ncbi:class I SAM-dependent methyltransferase [Nocardioides sp. Kera G14]|uniref:class I SAM-dependent methyltransferase n=1 Tax=Nocardioides sp. Kera G14 TaxID=2884264 RepID=UPI001D10A383|nr:class I SAM-dependent methyltransferase [Nocardioides sp. Kera G14]UDY23013.1 class I SAM-dependent methyltransferase [Nocardioides sp. Kera G14]